ncbi:MAG: Uma2 family endonuclease [Armatimonadetes bacterium]|nr:Uma2 family endonuclease [Armatimonadota bacterium]
MAVTLPKPIAAPLPAPAGRAWPQTPPLESGDRLTRAEFERRYEQHPEIKTAELIEGSVRVASPVRLELHARPHSILNWWVTTYWMATPGVEAGDNATVRLDRENEFQPDILLRIDHSKGGTSRITADGYLEGPPELVIEVAASTASYDLHQKLRVYQRCGVQEYLVATAYEPSVTWFALREGGFEPMAPDDQGVLRSEAFPGLWLKASALWERDPAAMLAALQEGLASPEHTAFVDQLNAV